MTNANETKRANVISKTVLRAEDQTAMAVKIAVNGAPNLKPMIVTLENLHPIILMEAAAHGISQKIGDAAAISRNPDNGQSATVQDKYEAMLEVFNRITADDPSWNAIREGGGAGSLLFKALCRIKPKATPESIKTWLDAKSDDEKKALRKNPAIIKAMAEIQAENVDPNIDTDELLDELDN